jgi:hypothetical protein
MWWTTSANWPRPQISGSYAGPIRLSQPNLVHEYEAFSSVSISSCFDDQVNKARPAPHWQQQASLASHWVPGLKAEEWLCLEILAIVADLDYRYAGCVSDFGVLGDTTELARGLFLFLLHHGVGIMREIDLAKALELELHHRGVVFDHGQLFEFVEDVWAAAKQQPDVGRWADEFMHETVLPAK